mgnify:CR=1 FL=1
MYTKSYVTSIDDPSKVIDTVTFGPISVLPEWQRKGIGTALIKESMQKAKAMGYKAVVIQGHPHNYCRHGFKNSKDFNISDADKRFPYGLLALELKNDVFKGNSWIYSESPVYSFDSDNAAEFDKLFAAKKKEYRYTQEEFSIACRAFLI